MADQTQPGKPKSPSSSTASHQARYPLSCTHCRQRKIKCDKVHPCTNCKRSTLECVFPERARPSKKKRNSSKATNDDLMQRLGRMEELIEKMKAEGKGIGGNKSAEEQGSRSPSMEQISREISGDSKSQGSPDLAGDGTTRYIGSAFFRSLTTEVEGLKQTMDDVSDDEDTPESVQSPPDSQTSTLFGSSILQTSELRQLHPNPNHISALCDIYVENVDPMAKVLHMPSFRSLVAHASSNIHDVPSNNYVEALLFSMYYSAVTSLTDDECMQQFQDSRHRLLARYKTGTETALANANMLSIAETGTLQALVIYLSSARTNDDTLYIWILVGIAIRLAHALGLHRENPKANLTPFQVELRRRLWWQIIHLDIRCSEDRGTDPMILDQSFNTKGPLNIHDADMSPRSMEPIVERQEFTTMTKNYVSNIFWSTAVQIGFVPPVREAGNTPPSMSFDLKTSLVDQIEKRLETQVLSYCNPADPLAWCTTVVVRLVMKRLRLAIYHPPAHDDRSPSHQLINRDDVLEIAVQILELSHLLDSEPAVARWSWHFKTHVQWHALAATLAELCVRNQGMLVDRAWRIVDTVFDDWAARIADSKNGMLWRPIKKLMSKAQSKRDEAKARVDLPVARQQEPLPEFTSLNPTQVPDLTNIAYHPDSVLGLSQKYHLEQGLPSDLLSTLNVSDTANTINWAEWDEFMQDYQMTDPGPVDTNVLQQDADWTGVWW
ncbi:hypothetical protein ACLMJK_004223 [Lecanora helva]